MLSGKAVDRHHPVPKSQGGKDWVWMHRICHRKLHSMWSEKQLRQMEQGGNDKLKDFFALYDLNGVSDIKVKYNTKAADFYRRRNNALALGQPFDEEAPDTHSGRTLLDGRRLDVNGVPIELTEEEKANLTEQERAMGGQGIHEEVKQAPVNQGSFFDIMQATLMNVATTAQKTATSLTEQETR